MPPSPSSPLSTTTSLIWMLLSTLSHRASALAPGEGGDVSERERLPTRLVALETLSATTGVDVGAVVTTLKELAPFSQDVIGVGSPSHRILASWSEFGLPEMEVIIFCFILFLLLSLFLLMLLRDLLFELSLDFPCIN